MELVRDGEPQSVDGKSKVIFTPTEMWVGSIPNRYRLNATKQPKELDYTYFDRNDKPVTTTLAIYELDADQLRIYSFHSGSPRPARMKKIIVSNIKKKLSTGCIARPDQGPVLMFL